MAQIGKAATRDARSVRPGAIGGQEAWRITLSPPVSGFAPWERTSPDLHIAAAALAALPPDTMIAIRQVGDFGLSLSLSLSMPRSKAGC